MPLTLWAEAMAHGTAILNRTYNKTYGVVPISKFQPNFRDLLDRYFLYEFGAKNALGFFVGFAFDSRIQMGTRHSARIFLPWTNEVIVRDVIKRTGRHWRDLHKNCQFSSFIDAVIIPFWKSEQILYEFSSDSDSDVTLEEGPIRISEQQLEEGKDTKAADNNKQSEIVIDDSADKNLDPFTVVGEDTHIDLIQ